MLSPVVQKLRSMTWSGRVTLLIDIHNMQHNCATALRIYLLRPFHKPTPE